MKKKLRIAIGADHRGYHQKEHIKNSFFSELYDITWIDVGAHNDIRSDYPEFARAVCYQLLKQQADYGLLLCGSGNGMSIAANRFSTVYAGIAWNQETARLCKEDDNVNVLVLPSDFIELNQTNILVDAWLNAEFKYDRYEKRLAMIDALTHN